MARICTPPDTFQEAEPFIETAGDLGDVDGLRPRRGQLEGERDAVESPADLDHRRCVLFRQLDGGIRSARPFEEQCHGRHVLEILERNTVEIVDGQRCDRPHVFTHHGERFATRGDDRDARRSVQDPLGDVGDRLDQVFAVVQQQQGVASAQHVDDRILDRHAEAGVDPQHPGERSERCIAVADGHQLDEMDAIGEPRRNGPGELQSERRLPDSCTSHQGDQPRLDHLLDEFCEQFVAPDQALQREWQDGR
jgi:hypothetical protein